MRRAKDSDAEWVFGELRAFAAFIQTKRSLFHEKYAERAIREAIENHLVFVAEREGERVGFILGMVHRHPFNPDIRVLSEHLWWVVPEHRRTRAASMLLDSFIEWGRAHVDWITFGTSRETALNPRSLLRRGFHTRELCFLMEVG